MNGAIEAVIFDMDGVLIDSEPLWRRAMVKGFGENGLEISEDECRKTTGKRLEEVVRFWLNMAGMSAKLEPKITRDIVHELIHLIQTEGKAMPGAFDTLRVAKLQGFKIGLATSSAEEILNAVLHKLEARAFFDAVISAEHLPHAKPHPEVFMRCAELLGIEYCRCVVIEDSVNGVIAGKSAQMTVIAVPDAEHLHVAAFAVADYRCERLSDAIPIITALKG